MKLLITGVSGTGKTYLTQYGRTNDLPAVDADTIPNLCAWYDGAKQVEPPRVIDKPFMDTHDFLWDERVLQDYLSRLDDVFFFGFAGNVFDVLAYFDKAFYLRLPMQHLIERLEHPSRQNQMGKTKDQQAEIITYAEQLTDQAKEHGLIFLTADQQPEQIYDEIRRLS